MLGDTKDTQPKAMDGRRSSSEYLRNLHTPGTKLRNYNVAEEDAVQLINTSPELSQRLFGITKPTVGSVAVTPLASLVQQQPQKQQQQQPQIVEIYDATTHLPTALGLKIRAAPQPQKPQTQESNQNCNSLLKQQLRAGLKDFDSTKTPQQQQSKVENNNNTNESCAALQSLASVAERQPPNTIQPPTANNLHQQFLLHMAANPMLKTNNDFYQQQQQQQQSTQQLQHHEEDLVSNNLELILDTNYKSEPELTLADETAGLDYKSTENSGNETGQGPNQLGTSQNSNCIKLSPRPVQRRRIRRKAQSTLDDQAEHLTEMSVRGLDLFRYASISEGVYQCTECAKENVQKTFKNKYSFQRHAFLYHEGKHRKVFPCPLCGKEFSRPDKMKNHMKMIHESYVAKDIGNFNPINYLISAAAAGEMHSTFFNQPQQSQQNQQPQVQIMMQPNTNEAAPKEDMILAQALTGGGAHQSPPSPLPTPAAALLKLHNDIIIKKEIVISPSPSPPPMAASTHAAAVATTQQRLEEVK